MGSEYFINSQELESKVRKLLPSQGGAGAGFDLSASTQIIPIIDLTESAEGSNVRQDLQTALSFDSITAFSIKNATTTVINNTGYYRVRGRYNVAQPNAGNDTNTINVTDGATVKIIDKFVCNSGGGTGNIFQAFDFIVFLSSGDSLTMTSASTSSEITGCTRQIATIDGELVNPT